MSGAEWRRPLVTCIRITTTPSHDHVSVWNRGGYAGSIIVNKGDGRDIADRLLPASDDTTDGSGELEWTRLVKP